MNGRKIALPLVLVLGVLLAAGCDDLMQSTGQSFINFGDFAVHRKTEYSEMRDGAGRRLALIPKGAPPPPGFGPTEVIEAPVGRVVAFGSFDVAILHALGADEAIVGVVAPAEKWHVDYMKEGFAEGRIHYVGEPNALDYERIKVLKPDMVMTWDPSIVPMMNEMGIPVVVTSTPLATCLATYIRFVQFISPFFGKEPEGDLFYARVRDALEDIREKTRGHPKPNAMWGDIFEKRVLVEPGNSWVAEMVGLAQSDYLFDDVYGASCIEISMERFIYSGRNADIYFTYRAGLTSKASLVLINPLLAGIKPMSPAGRAYSPRPHYSQSADRMDEILTEIAAILHPDVYPDHELQFFVELPNEDPLQTAQVN